VASRSWPIADLHYKTDTYDFGVLRAIERFDLPRTGVVRFTDPCSRRRINTRLASDLAIGLSVQLDVSTNGQSFLVRVASDVLSLVRARSGAKVTAQNCLILKSGSGVKCPAPVS